MKRAKTFITEVMWRYSYYVESYCIDVGEYVAQYGKYFCVGFLVVFGYAFLGLTMPIWYLPFKYFRKKL